MLKWNRHWQCMILWTWTEQRTYDSMFTAVPIYHGNDDEDFDEWADQLEALCEISR